MTAHKPQKFEVGDRVKYRARFLRQVGWYADVPVDGRVTAVHCDRVQVLWRGYSQPVWVLAINVMRAGQPDRA